MKRPPTKQRWIIWALLVAAMLLYRQFIYHPDIAQPSRWSRSSSDGVRALEAGDVATAERHFLDARSEAQRFRADDPRRGTTAHNLGALRLQQRRYAEAEALYIEALPFLERGSKTERAEAGAVLMELATVRVALHDLPGAESFVRRAIAVNEHARPNTDPVIAANYRSLAGVLLAQGKPADAVGAATRAADLAAQHETPALPVATTEP
jgi:tetratricopeptide (TPR) repeat protein